MLQFCHCRSLPECSQISRAGAAATHSGSSVFWALIPTLLPLPAQSDSALLSLTRCCDTSLSSLVCLVTDWKHSPSDAYGECYFSLLAVFLGWKHVLAHYVKQIISWLLVLHFAVWLDVCHSCQWCGMIFRRGQLAWICSSIVTISILLAVCCIPSVGPTVFLWHWTTFCGILWLLFMALDNCSHLCAPVPSYQRLWQNCSKCLDHLSGTPLEKRNYISYIIPYRIIVTINNQDNLILWHLLPFSAIALLFLMFLLCKLEEISPLPVQSYLYFPSPLSF